MPQCVKMGESYFAKIFIDQVFWEYYYRKCNQIILENIVDGVNTGPGDGLVPEGTKPLLDMFIFGYTSQHFPNKQLHLTSNSHDRHVQKPLHEVQCFITFISSLSLGINNVTDKKYISLLCDTAFRLVTNKNYWSSFIISSWITMLCVARLSISHNICAQFCCALFCCGYIICS